MYLQETNGDNGSTSLQDMMFMTFFFSTVFMTLYLLGRFCQSLTMIPVFKFNIPTDIIVSINVIINIHLIIIVTGPEYFYTHMQKFNLSTYVFGILLPWMLLKITNFINRYVNTTCDVDSMSDLDFGTGMAYNYYYGYLRLILPSMSNLKKGLIEKIENIEDIHNVTISIHKLLILIPASSYIPPDLKEASYQWMEHAMQLEADQYDRAGVKRRVYHNNVYKIYLNGEKVNSKPTYVVVEGATPLLTFFEVQKHAHPETYIYRKHCTDMIKRFYKKVKELIDNDPECADVCELIYYDDYDNNGIKVNVAKVILERLSKATEIN